MSRIEDLENLIRGYSNSYYKGKEEISDEEYDSLVIELSILKGKNMYGYSYRNCRKRRF